MDKIFYNHNVCLMGTLSVTKKVEWILAYTESPNVKW